MNEVLAAINNDTLLTVALIVVVICGIVYIARGVR